MWDALPGSFVGQSTGKVSPVVNPIRELSRGCRLQKVGEKEIGKGWVGIQQNGTNPRQLSGDDNCVGIWYREQNHSWEPGEMSLGWLRGSPTGR